MQKQEKPMENGIPILRALFPLSYPMNSSIFCLIHSAVKITRIGYLHYVHTRTPMSVSSPSLPHSIMGFSQRTLATGDNPKNPVKGRILFPPNSCMEVLMPSTSEFDLIWK